MASFILDSFMSRLKMLHGNQTMVLLAWKGACGHKILSSGTFRVLDGYYWQKIILKGQINNPSMHLVARVNWLLGGKWFVCLACRSQKPSRSWVIRQNRTDIEVFQKRWLCSSAVFYLNQRILGDVFDRAHFYKKWFYTSQDAEFYLVLLWRKGDLCN